MEAHSSFYSYNYVLWSPCISHSGPEKVYTLVTQLFKAPKQIHEHWGVLARSCRYCLNQSASRIKDAGMNTKTQSPTETHMHWTYICTHSLTQTIFLCSQALQPKRISDSHCWWFKNYMRQVTTYCILPTRVKQSKKLLLVVKAVLIVFFYKNMSVAAG